MKALIFAAGKGTRLRPFTDHHPKALAPVNGKPLLELNILFLKKFGIKNFVINIHHFGEQIENFLRANNNFGVNIEISDERKELLETGGGLIFAKKFLESEQDFLIMNADILTDLNITELISYHKKNDKVATLAVSDRESSRKLLFDDGLILRGWKNLKTGEEKLTKKNTNLRELAFSGIHCVSSKIFDHIKRKGKFSIMEEYLDMMAGRLIIGFEHRAKLIDVGKPEAISLAEKIFNHY
ncbi:nucleotidyltransferase family protein [Riemerella columbipharyngis]|uniref:Nucleotidyl transferase n=1 Tax=Riemerella columbipharyngis TaxID=1071918 RepID=A0A1G7D4C5_9FLAO|nr:nucleotidyltransferase family protein [Riemerella columbipharyngis]SDE46351.1 Nucleotidyl transferase [Riemerella columbipharyngis]